MDREGIVLSFPKSFRQGFARLCAHVGAPRMKAFSIGRCEVDVIGPREVQFSSWRLEILQLTTEIFRLLYVPESTKWRLILNHRSILTAVCLHHGINDEYTMASVLNLLYEYSSQTRKDAYSNLVFGLTHQCGLSEAKATEMLAWLNLPLSNSHQLRDRLRPLLRSKNDLVRKGAEEGLAQLDFLYHGICHKLAPQLCLNFQLSFVYQPLVFSDGLLFSLRVEFTESEGPQPMVPHPVRRAPPTASTLAVENASNFPFFIRKDRRVPSCVVLVAVSSLDYFSAATALAAQLRAQAISTDLWEEVFSLGGSLHEYCLDRSVQFVLQLVSLEDVVVYANSQFEETSATATEFRIVQNRSSAAEAIKYVVGQSRDTKEEKDVKTTDSSNQPLAENKNLPTAASMANVNLKSCSSKNLKHTHHQRKKIESHAYAILTPLVKRFNSRQTIDAVITDLPVDILTAIANLDRTLGHDQIFTEFQLIAKQSPKHKMDVMLLFDELEVFFEQQPNATNTVVVLLTPSVNETFYRLLM
ncbi:Non-specific serine/threonine protein kinase [Aphelenchoides fujianensis]|nr:Non-specific serine/threonine protein kinase [Aphelenchoides fujianensis]